MLLIVQAFHLSPLQLQLALPKPHLDKLFSSLGGNCMHCSSHAPTLVSLVQKGLCHSWSSIDHAGHGHNIELGGETKSVLTPNVAGKWSASAAADCRKPDRH